MTIDEDIEITNEEVQQIQEEPLNLSAERSSEFQSADDMAQIPTIDDINVLETAAVIQLILAYREYATIALRIANNLVTGLFLKIIFENLRID